ncbi:serine/arginine-rich splicing factor 4-like [Gigantopelta aegis]|uniref:serine/arginine-rich splicing factor 4-like n=1 Tax=Gigantopelta aegis TaxID=1735272 RepID=UPI001B88D77B|nr:serine/arginine-rich splicing factor 4-like [Gigantopelta aegis]XP_041352382.1 serine/arginine-rich splicing factor 4-like [Gigantopelta aegis]
MGTRVYIGRLSYHAREKDVERFFRGYGRIRDVMLKNGYGFVEFDDNRDADDAVYELNGKDLCGERVIVEHARGPRGEDSWRDRDRGYGRRRGIGSGSRRDKYGPPTRTEYRIIVENLSSRVSWQDLKDYMRQAGEVTYADAHKKHRNEGVVEFATYTDMKNAYEKLDGTEINGRKIKLIEDRPKKRSRSYSRSRSRSGSRFRRSRSRSRSRSCSRSQSSRSRSHSRSRSVSRDKKEINDRSKSKSPVNQNSKSQSRSRSRSRSFSRSKSRSPVKDAVANGEEAQESEKDD